MGNSNDKEKSDRGWKRYPNLSVITMAGIAVLAVGTIYALGFNPFQFSPQMNSFREAAQPPPPPMTPTGEGPVSEHGPVPPRPAGYPTYMTGDERINGTSNVLEAKDQIINLTAGKKAIIYFNVTHSDPNSNLLAEIVSSPIHGNLSLLDQDTGKVIYTPDPTFNTGSDTFTFKAIDSHGLESKVANVTIAVLPP